MSNIWQKIGGTKFIIALLVIILASILVYLGKIDGSRYAELVGAVSGLFFAGNAVATFGNAKMEQAKK